MHRAPGTADWSKWPQHLREQGLKGGLLYHGDNKEVLAHLLANGFRGQVKLIYIDPPFDSSADYVRKVQLRGPKGVFRASIPDWRAVVDCVLIDAHHNGKVFNVALADVPARKQDLVAGRYELPAPPAGATVAVKVIDMLGEERVVRLTV